METYTFICLAQNQVATVVDVQVLASDGVRGHAMALLREHASAASVEVWCKEAVVAVIDRDGLRPMRDGSSDSIGAQA
jgi:hypothetical protein